MPAKTGASHAFAAFLSIIIGSIISNFLSAHTGVLNSVSKGAGELLTGLTGISMSEEVTGLLAVSSLLAFLWGVAYHYARHGSENQSTEENNYEAGTQDVKTTQQMFRSVEGADGSHLLDQEGGPVYRTWRSTQATDETLRSQSKTELARAKSRLDDVHDRLYDIKKRGKAQRVMEIADSVNTLEGTLTRTGLPSPEEGTPDDRTGDAKTLDDETKRNLVVTHLRLADAIDELDDAVDKLCQGPADVHVDTIEECESLLRECERTLSRRQELIKQLGDRQ